ncbi:conserved virulence factor C family protein [Niallia taxi]|uniref:conserved virulence factor C family protein n=1 Tax=Niallia taxi TaxID=2499688 RepID=UPI00119CB8D9|nr:conserved virulence factor C family protein [Niallia taxi]MCT2344633.1 conserved virulence factor C family protein [Niallia taxi]MDE5053554.1 conserved virulence factor C family protein [Niallia taxi]MED3961776.1 conserved virulence factor C family protein [Niallia taxi]WOD61107.1 conserved virulence factor C family protein [Niallia taxi]
MKILAIEPTPSPNTMKINLNEELPMGKSNNYKKENAEHAPQVIQDILSIEGIRGVYHVADFLAVERNAKYDWKELLSKVRNAFGEEADSTENGQEINDHFGEIKVLVQMYKGIPMQIKLTDGAEEKRYGLPDQFMQAVAEVRMPNDNVVASRKWQEFGVRYGEFDEIGQAVQEELMAAYPQSRIDALSDAAKNPETAEANVIKREKIKLTLEDLDHEDWKVRYQKLEQSEDPTVEDIPVLTKALADEKPSIRRLATVYLGMIEDPAVLPSLYIALKDKTVTVRRTAGDCLSDLGFAEAMDAMISALDDKSKLVRWRAAMFLYEVGDERALEALKANEEDPEFEVSLQIKMAIERIELGEEAKGSVWKQMTEARKQD